MCLLFCSVSDSEFETVVTEVLNQLLRELSTAEIIAEKGESQRRNTSRKKPGVWKTLSIKILISAVKQLIASKINVFVYILYVCTVYIYYVYRKTHTYSIYFENIYMYLRVYIYIHINYIIYEYI